MKRITLLLLTGAISLLAACDQQAGAPEPPAAAEPAKTPQPAETRPQPIEVAEPEAIDIDLVLGEEVYAANCAGCHGSDGMGLSGGYPVLVGNESVLGDTDTLIRMTMNGIGPFPGAEPPSGDYGDLMPGIGFLTDEEIASVVSYIRQAWDNDAGPVSIRQIEAQR
ncbi:c-type cytochrome [Mucisphaera calidilacus]|uniref:c-type cytochrome n=1 Tax=Mucisphaera calidilacus TaxID=2527982 RepID=UPI0011A3A2D5|nr:cytochrome c [Mucisphaera calidilacus]